MVENNNSVLYTALADRTSLPSAKSILLSIASNHHQHSGILKVAGETSGSPKVRNSSEKEFAGVFGIAYDIYKEIIKSEEIPKEELSVLAERLSVLENALAEKYLDIQSRVSRGQLNGVNQPQEATLTNLRGVFARMMSDSVHHRGLLATIKTLAEANQQEKTLDTLVASCLVPESVGPVCQNP